MLRKPQTMKILKISEKSNGTVIAGKLNFLSSYLVEGESEGEVAVMSAKCCDRRNRANLLESTMFVMKLMWWGPTGF